MPVLVLGAGRRCWCCELCTWWRQVAGAGAGCRCWPGAWCWCWCCELAARGGDRLLVPVLVQGAVLFSRAYFCTYTVLCATSGSQPTIVSACFSTLLVVLDTAWPWASEAYGLCRLCALFCAHKLIRARSYGLIVLQIVASSVLQRQ